MIPLLHPAHRLAAPLLFLLAVGGAIAVAELWLSHQLPQAAPARRRASPPKRPKSRRGVTPRILA